MCNVNIFWGWDFALFFKSQVTCSDEEENKKERVVSRNKTCDFY